MEILGNIEPLSQDDRKLLQKLNLDIGNIFSYYDSGKSGAIVLLADIHDSMGNEGPHIIKIQDIEIGQNEFEGNKKLLKSEIRGNIPKIIDSIMDLNRIATVYQIAGGYLNHIEPLSKIINQDITRANNFILSTVSLLEKLNPREELITNRLISTPWKILTDSINLGKERLYGKNSIKQRLASFFPEINRLSILFENTDSKLPNPIAFAYQENLWGNNRIVNFKGIVHCDFHSENIICDLKNEKPWIIDWASYQKSGIFFFDWAYLEIDLLLRYLPCKLVENWIEWIYLCQFSSRSIYPENEPFGRIAPMGWKLIKPIRQEVQKIINESPYQLREAIEISYLISSLAASLNFIRKEKMADGLKMALLFYGACNLRRLLDELNIVQPQSVPLFFSFPRNFEDYDWEEIGNISFSHSEDHEKRYNIFICFAPQDIKYAKNISSKLKEEGYSVWPILDSFYEDVEKINYISTGINICPIFIDLLSPISNENILVQKQYLYAANKNKHIIPIIIESCEIPISFIGKESIDLTHNFAIGYKDLLERLSSISKSSGKSKEFHTKKRVIEQAYLDRILLKFNIWRDLYTPMSGYAKDPYAKINEINIPTHPTSMNPLFELLEERKEELISSSEKKEYKITGLVNEIYFRKRVALLGEPGAGKSTTLWNLISELANDAFKNENSPIPIIVPMGGFDGSKTLSEFIKSSEETYLGELSDYVDELIEEKRIVILLDGLNEMPRENYEKEFTLIKNFILTNKSISIVVTCREMDYLYDLDLDIIRISPLDPIQILAFLRNYLKEDGEELFWNLIDRRAREEYWPRFKKSGGSEFDFWLSNEEPSGLESPWFYWDWDYWLKIRDNPRSYLEIAKNPYMLYMIARVYSESKILPTNRGQLFRFFVDVLIAREKKMTDPEKWIDQEEQHRVLSRLAYKMQEGGKTGTSINIKAAINILSNERILYLAASENILIIGQKVKFAHQLLQEYFAAYALDEERLKGKPATEIWHPTQWWIPVGWEDTSVFLAGLYNKEPIIVLNWLRDSNPELAARCIIDGGIEIKDSIKNMLVAAWLPRLTNLKEPVLARAAIGRALGLINGDSRPGVCLSDDYGLPVIEWCEVREGSFIMGYEGESHEEYLNKFYISKYLITNAQYQDFINDSGYEEKWKRCWTNSGWEYKKERLSPSDYSETHTLPNHPRVGVSWYEAIAFCNWLNYKFRKYNRLEEGFEIRLPTEMEWEKAARSVDGRAYPWGSDFDTNKCNVIDIESTTCVGIYPNGSSVYGVMDMIGNAWKWCLTKWNEDPTKNDNTLEGNSRRVYRGGSWGSNIWRETKWDPDELNCGRRYWIVPEDDRPDAVGLFIVKGPILQK